jgi:hypothetical protein
MDGQLKKKIEQFVETNIVGFHQARANNLAKLNLNDVLKAKNPYLFRARFLETPEALMRALLDARLSSSEEGMFGMFMEELAVFVAGTTGNGQKSGVTGIDIELTRGQTRYLIAVKSGRNWGNAAQHAALKKNFETAVRVLRQSKHAGEIQPTLDICYGKFKTANNGVYLHIGGQSFWQLLSGEADLYMQMVEPLGYRAKEFNEAFEAEKAKVYGRMADEFRRTYCRTSGEIDWQKLVEFVSKNREA